MVKQNTFYTAFMMLLFFLASFCSNEVSGKRIHKAVKKKEPLQGVRIAWDHSTLLRLAPQEGRSTRYCGYPRMIQLFDKSLLCVYEVSGGTIECTKSVDKGNTWSVPVIIATGQNGINMAVPDILELKNQSLLVSYNPRPSKIDSSRHFGIRTKKSYDGGLTWKDERLLYEAGSKFEDGCWEPSQIQLPSGEIQLFFSDEGVYRSTNEQNISLFRSSDNGLTWTTQPQIVSFRAGKRDGMPVPVLLKRKNEILFSIEDNGMGEFKPSIIRTSMADNWNKIADGRSLSRNSALAETLPDSIYAGAPFLRQLQTGETILSYQGTQGRTRQWNRACMTVSIGDEDGRNFNRKTVPFGVPLNKQGLWNSLCVLDDNTVVALTSTNAYADNATEVWMMKGHVITEITATQQTVTPDGDLSEKVWDHTFPVFVGHTSNTNLQAATAWNNVYFFVAAAVKDEKLVTGSASFADDDGITIYLDTKNISAALPSKGMYAIAISADNVMMVKEGDNADWKQITIPPIIQHAVRKNADGYQVELAVPWSFVGGKPKPGERIGFTVSLSENTGAGLPAYQETIANSSFIQPYTWCTLRLQ